MSLKYITYGIQRWLEMWQRQLAHVENQNKAQSTNICSKKYLARHYLIYLS